MNSICGPKHAKILGPAAALAWALLVMPAAGEQGVQAARPGKSVTSLLTRIRHTSSQSYTRVTMELSAEVPYEIHFLKEDASHQLPPRLYVDLRETRLGMDSTQPIVVQDRLLRGVRVGQFAPGVVRVVLDLTSVSSHRAFLLPDPYRLVVDINASADGPETAALVKPRGLPRAIENPVRKCGDECSEPRGALPQSHGPKSLVRGLPPPPKPKAPAPGLRKIVLDPGHGGKDPGAIGIGGVAEKDIVLSLAKKLAKKLRQELGVEVVLTRQDDTFIPLEDRTAIANAEEADLFVSLHVNASPNANLRGIETYYLDNTNDEASIRLAARENATSRRNISDLQFILSDLTQNSKLEDSITLAHRIHSSLVSHMGRRYRSLKDLGVKKALFYVLVGARMPSVLLETFFITNKQDGQTLAREANQDAIVEGLFSGIKKYSQSPLVMKNP